MALRSLLGLASSTSLGALLLAVPASTCWQMGLAHAKERPVALVEVGEPEGFAGLTGPQVAVADVFYGGRRVGEAEVRFRPDTLTLAAPEKLVQLIPNVKDRLAVMTVFAGSLATNSHLVCSPAVTVPGCGRLAPTTTGIIFDRERFRIDVFVSPELLEVQPVADRLQLQAPQDGLTFVDSVDAVLSGSDVTGTAYNLQNRLIVADGTTRLRADVAAASGFGVQAERLAVEVDRPGWRYTAGAFWSPGSDLIARRKVLGIGIETQIDTRLDRDVVRGTPLVVFLRQRSRVDILLDRRVLATRIYDAGNQTLDTTGLPDGTYEVVLRIEELGGDRREERRLFTRNVRIPSAGQKVFFAYAGALVNDRSRAFVDVTAHPLAQAGAAWRLNANVAIDGSLMATDRSVVAELGGYLIAEPGQLRLAVIAGSRGDYGALVQLSSNGRSPFNFHFDLRRVVAPDQLQLRTDLADLALARRTFTQASGTLSYSFPQAQVALAASWRAEAGARRSYAVGPTVRWGIMRQGNWRLFVNGDAALTEKGTSGYLGFNLQFTGAGLSMSARGGERRDVASGTSSRSGIVGGVDAAVQRDIAGGLLDLGGGYERDIDRDVVNGNATFRTRRASFDADVSRTFGASQADLQYSIGMHTTVAGNRGHIDLQGRDRSEGMLLVKIDGAKPTDRFEVLVNDAPMGTVAGGGQALIAQPTYREYDVRIRPVSQGLVQYDGSSQHVVLYPGSVAAMTWKARTVVPVFGRIRLRNGGMAAGAAVVSEDQRVEADDSGFFQIMAGLDEWIDVQLSNGGACALPIPHASADQGLVRLGEVVCDPGVRLGSNEATKIK